MTKSKKSKKKKSRRGFWDSRKQYNKARYYMKKHKKNLRDIDTMVTVRAMLRAQEPKKEESPPKVTTKEEIENEKLLEKIQKFEKTGSLSGITFTESQKFAKDILEEGVEKALRSGPLPPPTGYDSYSGTWWDNPTDLQNRKRIDFFKNKQGKKKKLPKFGDNDVKWIQFFLGDSLLRPKKSSDIRKLKKQGLLGKIYPIQQEMNDFLDDNPWAKFEVWRGAGKTVIVLGKLLRKMCDNPNECFFLQSETDNKTIQRIRALKRELSTNQKIIAYYGYLPSDSASTGKKKKQLGKVYKGKWSEGVIELKRQYSGIEPTLMGISWNTGRGVGYHYTGGVLDDPWSGHNQNRSGDKQKFWEWWGEFYGSLEDAEFCWVLCTKKGQDDIYHAMDDKKLFATFRRKLVIEWPDHYEPILKNNAVIGYRVLDKDKHKRKYVYDDCFGKYTIENALLIRKRITVQKFESEYQNNPRRIEGKLFDWTKIKQCFPASSDPYARAPFHTKTLRKMRGVIFYDPAFGVSDSASYNALVALGKYDNRIYLLRIWMGHWSKNERIRAFSEARSMYPTFPFYCEDVMQQLNVIRDLTDTTGIFLRPFDPKGKGTKYKELFDGQRYASKKAKIYDGLEGIIEDERFYIVKSTPHYDEFEDEFKNFPDGLKMDVIDATSMGCLVIDRHNQSKEILDSNFVKRDSFLPKNMQVGSVFRIGKR